LNKIGRYYFSTLFSSLTRHNHFSIALLLMK
jgi:hypothetical protein